MEKAYYPEKTQAKNKTSDSCISLSGQLERLVRPIPAPIVLANVLDYVSCA
ncbi:MAG: hypothetical protein RAO92_07900 [Candidatus Euphemobacter frigidus]|nr:hypothetical protein [Candidatus Euphemobacter frigidus]MDP8276310.1 hypothetical protein [Candidatus Euphemobacter frigidus]